MSERRCLSRKISSEGVAGFEPIVRSASPRLFRVAARMLGSAADAEDAVQEAFARAYDALSTGRYDEQLKMEAWLVTIVTHVCLDVLRGRKLRRTDPEEAADGPPSSAPELPEDQALALLELSRWLEGLPPDQRAAVVLRFMEGMTSAEVGVALGVSEGAVEQRILRARATLRKRMGSGDEEG